MDLVTLYIQKRQIMLAALKHYSIRCKECDGHGVVFIGEEYLGHIADRLGAGLFGRGRQFRGFFPTQLTATCCPKCNGEGHLPVVEAELTHEERLEILRLYTKNKDRKDRQAKAKRTNKTWDRKTTWADPRFK
jgi:Ribonuclease G/E